MSTRFRTWELATAVIRPDMVEQGRVLPGVHLGVNLSLHPTADTAPEPLRVLKEKQALLEAQGQSSLLMRAVGPPRTHSCSACGVEFATETECSVHRCHQGGDVPAIDPELFFAQMQSDLQPPPPQPERFQELICPFCGKSFGLKLPLRNHISKCRRKPRKGFVCPFETCGSLTFPDFARLDAHLSESHGRSLSSLEACEHCQRVFLNSFALAAHLCVLSPEDMFLQTLERIKR